MQNVVRSLSNKCFSIIVVFVSLILAGCQPSAKSLTETEKNEIVAEVDEAATAWWDAWKDVDYSRGMAFFEDVPEAAWTTDEGILYTVPGMNAEWEGEWCSDCQKQQIDFTDSKTIVLAPDIVYTIRQFDATVTDKAGKVWPQTKGVETVVWIKRDGEWKVLVGHESVLKESWQTRLAIDAM